MPALVSAVDLILYLSVVLGVAHELGYFYRGRHRGVYKYWLPKVSLYDKDWQPVQLGSLLHGVTIYGVMPQHGPETGTFTFALPDDHSYARLCGGALE